VKSPRPGRSPLAAGCHPDYDLRAHEGVILNAAALGTLLANNVAPTIGLLGFSAIGHA